MLVQLVLPNRTGAGCALVGHVWMPLSSIFGHALSVQHDAMPANSSSVMDQVGQQAILNVPERVEMVAGWCHTMLWVVLELLVFQNHSKSCEWCPNSLHQVEVVGQHHESLAAVVWFDRLDTAIVCIERASVSVSSPSWVSSAYGARPSTVMPKLENAARHPVS